METVTKTRGNAAAAVAPSRLARPGRGKQRTSADNKTHPWHFAAHALAPLLRATTVLHFMPVGQASASHLLSHLQDDLPWFDASTKGALTRHTCARSRGGGKEARHQLGVKHAGVRRFSRSAMLRM